MKPEHARYLLFLFGLLLIAGCGTTTKVSLNNLVYLYQDEKQFSGLNSRVFHTNDSMSVLFTEVNFNDLVYRKDPYTGFYTCSYRLSFKLVPAYDSKDILQTSSVVSGDSLNYGKQAGTVHSFDFKARYPGQYVLEITLFDLNRQSGSTRYLEIDKRTMNGSQGFLVMDRNNELVFSDIIPEDLQFRIISGRTDVPHLYVNCYKRDFPVARPPYIESKEEIFDFQPDSTFQVTLYNGESEWLSLPGTGFFHFRVDTLNKEGLTLYDFYEGFPEIITAGEMRAPLRYITTRKEYDTLMTNPDVKAAVDEFWLQTAHSAERAKVLIQKYYSGVEEANRFFTSYLEGWKTDRGLIFIVFGEPDYVYRGKDSEDWIYGEPQNRSSLRFSFYKINNPFTDNDFMLMRSVTMKEAWFITVQSWRR